MNPTDIHGMALALGLPSALAQIEAVKQLVAEAVAAEREACAVVCDDFERAKWESVNRICENGGRLAFAGPMHCAKAIRARGNA
jgi:hypothetical protein